MHQITTEEIPQDVLDRYIPQEIKLREKLIRKVNEFYQYHSETYLNVQKGDYSFITRLLAHHIYHYL
jgi:hypothetical protein